MRNRASTSVSRRLSGGLRNGGQINHERGHQTFDGSLDSYRLGYSDNPKLCPGYSVCLRACTCPFGIVDAERPCPSTTYFEGIGWHENGTGIRCVRIP